MLSQFILKISSRCNLNCAYCYVYNKEDDSWAGRPPLMSEETFDATLRKIKEYCERVGQDKISIFFHGGEPCLIGVERFAGMCSKIESVLAPDVRVAIGIQTNGTLLDEEWARCFARYDLDIGISLDGPAWINDVQRVDHQGRGSHEKVVAGIRTLLAANLDPGIMCVIPLGTDPLSVHSHFLETGCHTITYLLPQFTHDNIGAVRRRYGATPCADFLIPVFDDWWNNSTMDIRINDLKNIIRMFLGGDSQIETYGNRNASYVSVETDGTIEGLDLLRGCENKLAATGLDVFRSDFEELSAVEHLPTYTSALPRDCIGCVEQDTCGGGYLPHRYSRERRFDNRSVWCADILKLFGHMRDVVGISVEETAQRRKELISRRLEAATTKACDD